jgi:hypothetical protein
MRRWDRLLDSHVEEDHARGVSSQSVAYTEARLNRWGRWLKGRRPRVGIERIDAEMITHYISNCSSFRAKATGYATLSSMRGFGDYLVRQGLWKINPLRWMKGPKVSPYSRLPKRIDHAHERCVPLPEMVLRCLEAYLPLGYNQLEKTGLCGECALCESRWQAPHRRCDQQRHPLYLASRANADP